MHRWQNGYAKTGRTHTSSGTHTASALNKSEKCAEAAEASSGIYCQIKKDNEADICAVTRTGSMFHIPASQGFLMDCPGLRAAVNGCRSKLDAR